MAQHMYRAMDFQVWFALEEYAKFDSGELLLGVDVAKTAFYAAITQHGSDAYDVVYFERDDIRTFIEMLAELEFLDITLVMEPTGTYGDPLLEQAHKAGFASMEIASPMPARYLTVPTACTMARRRGRRVGGVERIKA